MKQVKRRTLLVLLLVIALGAGIVLFCGEYIAQGASWAAFSANSHTYQNGHISRGTLLDRYGVTLYDAAEDAYAQDWGVRISTLHAVGDKPGNISTAAKTVYRDDMVGFNPLTGTTTTGGNQVYLTIDSDLNALAYGYLAGYKGTVAIYNYKTGEVLCMMSAPAFDPQYVTEVKDGDKSMEGAYLNRALSATFTPGSVFKVVTAAAALEKLPDVKTRTFTCTGSYEIDGEKVTCPYAHGKVDFYGALAKSCNGAYASLAVKLGGAVLQEYTEKAGLTDVYEIDGIRTAAGSFNFDSAELNIGWAGIGQFEDQVNPLAMMVYAGAIAGEGKAAKPVLLRGNALLAKGEALLDKDGGRARAGKVKLLEAGTARQISDMMRNNVKANYGDGNYSGLSLHAKTGTAEVGRGKSPHSWFVGFSGDYAFAVCLENSGYGATAAGPAANQVLQAMKKAGYLGKG